MIVKRYSSRFAVAEVHEEIRLANADMVRQCAELIASRVRIDVNIVLNDLLTIKEVTR